MLGFQAEKLIRRITLNRDFLVTGHRLLNRIQGNSASDSAAGTSSAKHSPLTPCECVDSKVDQSFSMHTTEDPLVAREDPLLGFAIHFKRLYSVLECSA